MRHVELQNLEFWHEFQNSAATWQTAGVTDIWHWAPNLMTAPVSRLTSSPSFPPDASQFCYVFRTEGAGSAHKLLTAKRKEGDHLRNVGVGRGIISIHTYIMFFVCLSDWVSHSLVFCAVRALVEERLQHLAHTWCYKNIA